MTKTFSISAITLALFTLNGCASAMLPAVQTLPTGQAVSLQAVLQENSGSYACVNYQSAGDSCESLITYSLNQKGYTSRETGAASSFGSTQRITVISNGRFSNGRGCVSHSDVRVEVPSDPNAQGFLQRFIQDTIIGYGGVCTTMYQASDGYVARTVGGDGRIFPPGDTSIRFFDSPKTVRSQ